MQRRHDIDALRVIAFSLLILYHAAMVYVADWDFHIKSAHTFEWLQYPMIALNRWLPAVPFACYPLLLVLLNVRWFRLLSANRAAALDFMQLIARAVFVPAFVFLGGTLLRARLNFPRPYEQPGFTPLVPKETHGKSFPSRHALSAAVLAAVWCYFYPAAGACMVVVALLICALRVLAGAHYVRDVAAGALLGFALGAAGMWLL